MSDLDAYQQNLRQNLRLAANVLEQQAEIAELKAEVERVLGIHVLEVASLEGVINDLKAENLRLREELESYRRDEVHIVEFREDGWTIQHPLACRPDLFGCPFNGAILNVDQHPVGRYRATMEDGELIVEEAL